MASRPSPTWRPGRSTPRPAPRGRFPHHARGMRWTPALPPVAGTPRAPRRPTPLCPGAGRSPMRCPMAGRSPIRCPAARSWRAGPSERSGGRVGPGGPRGRRRRVLCPVPTPPPPGTSSAPGAAQALADAPIAGTVNGGARTGAAGSVPSRDELVQEWGDHVLAGLPSRARARFRVGRFTGVDGGTAVFALPNETHRSFCEELRLDVEAALRCALRCFGPPAPRGGRGPGGRGGPGRGPRRRPGPCRRGTGPPAGGGAPVAGDPPPFDDPRDEGPDLLDPEVLAAETEPAGAGLTPEQRLKQAFPGAQEV